MANPATSALTNTKELSQTAEATPKVLQDPSTGAEMIVSAPQWPVENDAWTHIHTEVQESAAAKDQAAHEVLFAPCHAPDPAQKKPMSDLNEAIASMQVTFDALTVGSTLDVTKVPPSLHLPRAAFGPGTPPYSPRCLILKPWNRFHPLLGSAL